MSRHPVVRVLGCAVLGVVVALVGTGVHRLNPPWGLVLAYLTVLSAAVLVRAWARAGGLVVLGAAVLGTTLAAAYVRPGGDVLVGDGPVGYAWIAGALVVAVAGVLPRRMFSDRPMGNAQPPPERP